MGDRYLLLPCSGMKLLKVVIRKGFAQTNLVVV